MIQRIQTIWWFLIGIFFIIMIPTDWIYFILEGNTEALLSANGVTQNSETLITGWPLMVYLLGMALFNFAIIFLFKNRILQSKLTFVSIIMSLGFYAVMYLYRFLSFQEEVLSADYCWPVILPLINAILGFMAWRSVLKDEAYVRSLDRLR